MTRLFTESSVAITSNAQADPGKTISTQHTLPSAEARNASRFVRERIASAHAGAIVHTSLHNHLAALDALEALETGIQSGIEEPLLASAMNTALTNAQDAHLYVDLPDVIASSCQALPLSLTWTDAGLLSLGKTGSVPAGARIISFAGYSLDALAIKAQHLVPAENPYRGRHVLARRMPRFDYLCAMGIHDADQEGVEIEFYTPDGETRQRRLYLAPSIPNEPPLIKTQYFPEDSTAVFRLECCTPSEEFLTALDLFVYNVQEQGIQKVAIDLRGNPGGDACVSFAIFRAFGLSTDLAFSVHMRLSPELAKSAPYLASLQSSEAFTESRHITASPDTGHLTLSREAVAKILLARLGDRQYQTARDRKLFVLTDGGTFSSAALTALMVRDFGLGLLVGEPTGNSASFNASEIDLQIPGMRQHLCISTAYLQRPNYHTGPAPTLIPDYFAPSTPYSLRSGKDPAVDLVRRYEEK